jgi:hypothetical protein
MHYLPHTSAVNEYSSCLIETRIEVSLQGSNVLGQMNKLVIERPNINEAYKIHTHKEVQYEYA